MPLILAIEPDRRQASQLTALVRGRLKADLVIGETADRALAALGERVPDLVLTAALLSPKDEAALGQRLRQLNGVAAHVQMLTIPVLATRSQSDDRSGSILSALRRDKPRAAPAEGCDPAVFAEQCREYLERAALERQVHVPHDDHASDSGLQADTVAQLAERAANDTDLTSFAEPMTIEAPGSAARQQGFAPISAFDRHAAATTTVSEPAPIAEAAAPQRMDPEPPRASTFDAASAAPAPVEKPVRPRKAQPLGDPLEVTHGPASLVAALALFEADEESTREEPAQALAVLADEPSVNVEWKDDERAEQPVAAMTSETSQEAADAADPSDDGMAMDLSSLLDESAGNNRRDERQDQDSEVEVYDLDVSCLQSTAFTLDATADEGTPDVVVETEQPQEWVDIIEALRRDAEQVPIRKSRVEPAKSAPAPVKASEPSAGAAAKAKRQPRPGAQPAQDEWGFFDPDQCGFTALLEKLQEITEDDKQRPRRPPSA